MKISCQSCAAKYTIADEKVAGKVVKIRCKKCGSTIVVNGNEGAQAAEGGGVFDYTAQPSSTDQWTVSVSETDQRTMTVTDIVAEYKAGVITDDTYCWKDGMADWHPLSQIEELYAACSMGPRPTLASGVQDDPGLASGSGLGALFSGNDAPPGGGFGESLAAAGGGTAAAARRTGGRAPGADIFGGVEHAGGEDDVLTSAPHGGLSGSGESPGKLTGQRNENSVLFSLSALTEKAGGGPSTSSSSSSSSSSSKSSAPNEASGLIDIRALSASAGGPKNSDSAGRADDIMNLAGGGAFTAALAAPVLLPTAPESLLAPVGGVSAGGQESSGKGKTMMIVALAVVLLLGGVVALVIALRGPTPQPVATTTTTTPDSVPTSSTPTPAVAAPAETSTATDPLAALSAKPPTVGTPPAAPARPAGGFASPSRVSTGGAKPADPPPAAAPDKPAEPAKPKSLEDAMRASAGGGAGQKPAAEAAGDKQFDRGAASAALGAAAASASSCKKADGPTGSGHVKVTFEPRGAVSTVEVDTPPFAGTAVGGCVAAKFRGARVPPFSGSSVTVGKSFSIN